MPIAAALPALIPAVGGMLGGLFGGGNKAINGTTQAEGMGLNTLGNQAQQQATAAGRGNDFALEQAQYGRNYLGGAQDLFGKGETFLNQASNAINPAADYYNGILSGNRANMMGAMGPEITTINNQANQARRQLATMGPMGGGRASAMAQIPMQAAGQIGTMFQQARPMAAQGMLNVGNARGNLAGITGGMAGSMGNIGQGLSTNTLGNLLNFGQGGTATGSALLNYGLGRSNANQSAGGAFGGGIYDILKSVPWGNIISRGGGGGGGTNPDPGNWGY